MPLPFVGNYPVTASFNDKDSFFPNGHPDVNWGMPVGTPIIGATNGTVIAARTGYNGGLGNYVRVKLQNGDELSYNHLSIVYAKVGDMVRTGQTLGLSGATGLASGPHFGMEAFRNGQKIDPLRIIGGIPGGGGSGGGTPAEPQNLDVGQSAVRVLVGTGIVIGALILIILGIMLLAKEVELEELKR